MDKNEHSENPFSAATRMAGIAFARIAPDRKLAVGSCPLAVTSCAAADGPEFRDEHRYADGLRYLVFSDAEIVGTVKVVNDHDGYVGVSANVEARTHRTDRAFRRLDDLWTDKGVPGTLEFLEVPALGIYVLRSPEIHMAIDLSDSRAYDDEAFRNFYKQRWYDRQLRPGIDYEPNPEQGSGPDGTEPPDEPPPPPPGSGMEPGFGD